MAVRSARHSARMQEESHAQYDADLGWSNRPNLRITSLYGPGVAFSTNQRGFRGRLELDLPIPPGTRRVICLGDSFTMGYGVADDQSYPSQLQELCGGIQVVNMGQGGYGLDQDYLWYKRDGEPLAADVLVVAVIAEDFYRMGSNRFIGYAKPSLEAKDGKLIVRGVPVPRSWGLRGPAWQVGAFAESLAMGRLALWLRTGSASQQPQDAFYGVVADSVYNAAELALDDLSNVSRKKGQAFVLLYLPSGNLLENEPTREAVWMKSYSRRHGVPFIDFDETIAKLNTWQAKALFRPDYHFTVEGNRLVAEVLLQRLRSMFPDLQKSNHP